MTQSQQLTKASVVDSLAVVADVLAPNIAKGLVIRRPPVVQMAARLGLDRRAIRRVQRLDEKYGPGPIALNLPFRHSVLILRPADAMRVLEETPDPFATETKEKRSALAHLEPRGSLISTGMPRQERRRYNDEVLDSEQPMHRLAERFMTVVREEAAALGAGDGARVLTWDDFIVAWYTAVRRVVFGDGARDDHALTDMLAELRSHANWGFLRPRSDRLRRKFFERMRDHARRAEPGSLAAVMAATHASPDAEPLHQVPQWLFAFDPAGMATFRALALLAIHPDQMARARAETQTAGTSGDELPLLRAAVLESLRLWPTTPLVMRETIRETAWDGATLPAETGVIIFALYFHRDDRHLPYADRFAPDVWLDGQPPDWPLIPFSGGPGICPGRHLVLLMTSVLLGTIIDRYDVRQLRPHRLDPDQPLPATLDNYRLRFRLTPRS